MIDFHAHILPGIDDGSKNVEESMTMLDAMRKQGVKTVIATPHFYANDESVEHFLMRRSAARNLLPEKLADGPEIILGAEVKYYSGISYLPDLKKLRVENSRLLLLEMPYEKWSESVVKEVVEIASLGRVMLVLAHIERFLPMQNKGILEKLLSIGVCMQVNAGYFDGLLSRNKAVKMLRNQQIHFIGSDCHNLTDRPPDILKAYSVIEKKLGRDFAEDFIGYGNDLFEQSRLG